MVPNVHASHAEPVSEGVGVEDLVDFEDPNGPLYYMEIHWKKITILLTSIEVQCVNHRRLEAIHMSRKTWSDTIHTAQSHSKIKQPSA